ncbi:MAG: hypothetical protein IJR99_10510 [Kiritimatiellae bacterium]|nr:hypothetical protein [Kiritimatiellia bacterium]
MKRIRHIFVCVSCLTTAACAAVYVNPCGIAVGDTAYYRVSAWPASIPDTNLVWSAEPASRVSFPQGPHGRAVAVRGDVAGDVSLSLSFATQVLGMDQNKPVARVRVVEPSVVDVNVYIVCSTGGYMVKAPAEVQTVFAGVNDIYRQVGVSFRVVGIHSVTNDDWLIIWNEDGDWPKARQVTAYAQNTGGLECYFVQTIDTVYGLSHAGGMVLEGTSDARAVAHEIGHACGLKDVYVNSPDDTPLAVTGEISRERLGAAWGSTGGRCFYASGLHPADLLRRLLMYGDDDNSPGCAFSYGDIYGL